MSTEPSGYMPDSDAKLRVWTVTADLPTPEDGGGIYPIPHPVRVPAHTPAEAVQAAAAMSGLPRADWCRYWWTPTTHEETRP